MSNSDYDIPVTGPDGKKQTVTLNIPDQIINAGKSGDQQANEWLQKAIQTHLAPQVDTSKGRDFDVKETPLSRAVSAPVKRPIAPTGNDLLRSDPIIGSHLTSMTDRLESDIPWYRKLAGTAEDTISLGLNTVPFVPAVEGLIQPNVASTIKNLGKTALGIGGFAAAKKGIELGGNALGLPPEVSSLLGTAVGLPTGAITSGESPRFNAAMKQGFKRAEATPFDIKNAGIPGLIGTVAGAAAGKSAGLSPYEALLYGGIPIGTAATKTGPFIRGFSSVMGKSDLPLLNPNLTVPGVSPRQALRNEFPGQVQPPASWEMPEAPAGSSALPPNHTWGSGDFGDWTDIKPPVTQAETAQDNGQLTNIPKSTSWNFGKEGSGLSGVKVTPPPTGLPAPAQPKMIGPGGEQPQLPPASSIQSPPISPTTNRWQDILSQIYPKEQQRLEAPEQWKGPGSIPPVTGQVNPMLQDVSTPQVAKPVQEVNITKPEPVKPKSTKPEVKPPLSPTTPKRDANSPEFSISNKYKVNRPGKDVIDPEKIIEVTKKAAEKPKSEPAKTPENLPKGPEMVTPKEGDSLSEFKGKFSDEDVEGFIKPRLSVTASDVAHRYGVPVETAQQRLVNLATKENAKILNIGRGKFSHSEQVIEKPKIKTGPTDAELKEVEKEEKTKKVEAPGKDIGPKNAGKEAKEIKVKPPESVSSKLQSKGPEQKKTETSQPNAESLKAHKITPEEEAKVEGERRKTADEILTKAKSTELTPEDSEALKKVIPESKGPVTLIEIGSLARSHNVEFSTMGNKLHEMGIEVEPSKTGRKWGLGQGVKGTEGVQASTVGKLNSIDDKELLNQLKALGKAPEEITPTEDRTSAKVEQSAIDKIKSKYRVKKP